jgi:hypothetical protein
MIEKPREAVNSLLSTIYGRAEQHSCPLTLPRCTQRPQLVSGRSSRLLSSVHSRRSSHAHRHGVLCSLSDDPLLPLPGNDGVAPLEDRHGDAGYPGEDR